MSLNLILKEENQPSYIKYLVYINIREVTLPLYYLRVLQWIKTTWIDWHVYHMQIKVDYKLVVITTCKFTYVACSH
jgi:hypothetical protein